MATFCSLSLSPASCFITAQKMPFCRFTSSTLCLTRCTHIFQPLIVCRFPIIIQQVPSLADASYTKSCRTCSKRHARLKTPNNVRWTRNSTGKSGWIGIRSPGTESRWLTYLLIVPFCPVLGSRSVKIISRSSMETPKKYGRMDSWAVGQWLQFEHPFLQYRTQESHAIFGSWLQWYGAPHSWA